MSDQLGYRIIKNTESDTESLTDSIKEEYPSDEEINNGYTFISKHRKKKKNNTKVVLVKEDYDSE
tara:strand:+ start:809 stop:1003 length:195 start_codon:yes stop_codon:yes gene_type:complete